MPAPLLTPQKAQIMDYVFSHFCGIFSTALVALLLGLLGLCRDRLMV